MKNNSIENKNNKIKIIDNFYLLYKKMGENKFLNSIKNGFTLVVPIMLIGAFALLLQNFPIEFISRFLNNCLNGAFVKCCSFLFNATFGIASVYIVISITFFYAKQFAKNNILLVIMCCLCSVSSYMLLACIPNDANSIDITLLNVQNIFASLIVSLVSTRLFFLFNKLITRKKDRYLMTSYASFIDAFKSIIPMTIVISIFILIAYLIKFVLLKESFSNLLIFIITKPFFKLGRSFGSALLIILCQSVCWFFGIHGNNTFEAVNISVFFDKSGEIVTKTFFDCFVFMGGSGTAICLLIAILLFSKSKIVKPISINSIIPTLFNINEILVFGVPVVLNPVLIIPFIITPLFCLTTSYLSIKLGLVAVPCSSVIWTTPVLISGYKATNDFHAVLLQLFNLVCGVFIYWPFVKINDTILLRSYHDDVENITSYYKDIEKQSKKVNFLSDDFKYSKSAYQIISDLAKDIRHNKIGCYYQPLCDKDGKVIACEALLRWKNQCGMMIYPPLVIELAKQANLYSDLTREIIKSVIRDFKEIDLQKTKISINIQPYQLNDNELIEWIVNECKNSQIPDNTICLEITEDGVLDEDLNIKEKVSYLKENGICLAIDDFSMGHTSLNYLKRDDFLFLKIDGSLIKQLNEERVKNIISSIIKLGDSLNFKVVAEYVETEKERDCLFKMGCCIYQGYLFSKAIPFEEYKHFLENHI